MTDQTLDLDAIEARAKLQRRLASGAFDVVCCDDLDALTAEVRKLREALKPFGDLASILSDDEKSEDVFFQHDGRVVMNGDLRRAEALKAPPIMTLIERLESAEQVSFTDMEEFCQVFRDMGLDEFPVTAARSEDGMRISVFAMALRDLSAAVALVERALPGWVWQTGTTGDGATALVLDREYAALTGEARASNSRAATPALALCAALLKALKPKEPSA